MKENLRFKQLRLNYLNKQKSKKRASKISNSLTRLIFAKVIFAWIFYRGYQNQNFSRGFIFADGQNVYLKKLFFLICV